MALAANHACFVAGAATVRFTAQFAESLSFVVRAGPSEGNMLLYYLLFLVGICLSVGSLATMLAINAAADEALPAALCRRLRGVLGVRGAAPPAGRHGFSRRRAERTRLPRSGEWSQEAQESGSLPGVPVLDGVVRSFLYSD